MLRAASRVTVVRMALHNDTRSLIAMGTGTYIMG